VKRGAHGEYIKILIHKIKYSENHSDFQTTRLLESQTIEILNFVVSFVTTQMRLGHCADRTPGRKDRW